MAFQSFIVSKLFLEKTFFKSTASGIPPSLSLYAALCSENAEAA
jgi:hypothetical protein